MPSAGVVTSSGMDLAAETGAAESVPSGLFFFLTTAYIGDTASMVGKTAVWTGKEFVWMVGGFAGMHMVSRMGGGLRDGLKYG